jgi:PEGA domain
MRLPSTRLLSAPLAAAGLAAVLLVGSPAGAQPARPPAAATSKPLSETLTGVAKAEYEGAKLLYGDKDYANALIKFQRAYELSDDPRLLWNVAVCEKNLRRYTRTLATLKKYREKSGPNLSESDKQEALDLEKAVQGFISKLDLTVNEAGAAVTIDGEAIGTTPIAGPLTVDIGVRTIRVTKRGFKDYEQVQRVVGGADVKLAVTLEKDLRLGKLLITAGPEDLIALDGKAVGRGSWEGTVRSGGHTLRVSAPGMTPHQSEVLVKDSETRRIPVSLTPLPASGPPTWLWIAGGIALVGGTAAAAALMVEPTPVQGNLVPGTHQLSAGAPRGSAFSAGFPDNKGSALSFSFDLGGRR